MRYIERTPGTPVFEYVLPYNTFENYAYDNIDIYGDDPDWDAVRSDYMSMVRDYLMPFAVGVDDLNRRSVFHEVHLEESPDSFGYRIWITDRAPEGIRYGPKDVVEEREYIIRYLEHNASRLGFYEYVHPESDPEWIRTAPKGKRGYR